MFSQAIQHIQGQNHQGGINEQDALNAHQQVYNSQGGSGGPLAAGAIGTAGALQALKSMLSSGGQQGTFPVPHLSPIVISLPFPTSSF